MPVNRIRINWITRELILGEDDSDVYLQFQLLLSNAITVEGRTPMAVRIKDSQEDFTVRLRAVSLKGNPASFDGVPIWTTSQSSLITVTPQSDQTESVVHLVGPTGNVQVQAEVDADVGEGVRTLNGVLDLEIFAEAEMLILEPFFPPPTTP